MPALPWALCALILLAVTLWRRFSPEARRRRWDDRELEWRRRCRALGVRPPKMPLPKQDDLVYDRGRNDQRGRDE